MLPTNEKAIDGILYLYRAYNELRIAKGITKEAINNPKNIGKTINKHLYFLSDKEIKEGDFVLVGYRIVQAVLNCGTIGYNSFDGVAFLYFRGHKKIIATSDKSLKLPQPSQSFIEAYVKAYNEGKPIEWVDVECELDLQIMENLAIKYVDKLPYDDFKNEVNNTAWKLKVDKNNTITIRKIKDSWSRDDIDILINKLFPTWAEDYLIYLIESNKNQQDYSFAQYLKDNKWIEENI